MIQRESLNLVIDILIVLKDSAGLKNYEPMTIVGVYLFNNCLVMYYLGKTVSAFLSGFESQIKMEIHLLLHYFDSLNFIELYKLLGRHFKASLEVCC